MNVFNLNARIIGEILSKLGNKNVKTSTFEVNRNSTPERQSTKDFRYGCSSLPDGITGATPKKNFYSATNEFGIDSLESFRVMVEVNVAFDENEFYSEYDFLEDSLYHGGTGLLGQPSLIYGSAVSRQDEGRYYIVFISHGHHSGATGELITDMKTVTTAKYIVERIVVGVKEAWYK